MLLRLRAKPGPCIGIRGAALLRVLVRPHYLCALDLSVIANWYDISAVAIVDSCEACRCTGYAAQTSKTFFEIAECTCWVDCPV